MEKAIKKLNVEIEILKKIGSDMPRVKEQIESYQKAVTYLTRALANDLTSEKDLRVCEVSNRALNLGQEALSEFLTQGMNSWGARYEVQYSDYSENQWTAPVLITEDRIARIINDNSVKKVRMSFYP